MTTRYRYPQPANEDDFEEFCLALLRDVWNCPHLQRYGRRGQRQHGVGILDQSGRVPLRAVRCKHHASENPLTSKEVEKEVTKTLSFPDVVGEYYVLTTFAKGTEVQDTVRRINREHSARGLFLVSLLTWDEIERLIDQSPAAKQFLGLDPSDGTVKAVRAEIAPLLSLVGSVASDGNASHGDLDEIKAYLDRGDPQGADVLAQRLRQRALLDLSNGQRWRLCTLWADARIRLGENSEGAKLIAEALSFAPESEHAVVNAIRALRMTGEVAGARKKGNGCVREIPKFGRNSR